MLRKNMNCYEIKDRKVIGYKVEKAYMTYYGKDCALLLRNKETDEVIKRYVSKSKIYMNKEKALRAILKQLPPNTKEYFTLLEEIDKYIAENY